MPLVWISISFAAGIVLASLWTLPANIWLSLGLFFIFLLILSRLPESSKLIARFIHPSSLILHPYAFILPAFFLFGAWQFQFRQPTIDAFHIAFYNDREYETLVTGTLTEPPDARDSYSNLTLAVEAVDSGSGDMPASGLLLVRAPALANYEYGQRLRVRGLLKTPPENEEFSYRDYLARYGIHATMSTHEITVLPGNGGNFFFRFVYALKGKLLENAYRLYHDPEASLLAGILLGVDTGMTKELQTAFKNTGTAHIIAISGFNIAIIAGIFFSVFKNVFGERIGAAFAAVGILFYTLLVGADWAVVRAAIMGILSLLARQLGRRNNGMNSLGMAVLLMLFINPMSLWDAGFQLSAAATLGLILYAEPFSNFTLNLLTRLFKQDMKAFARILNESVTLTFAAQLTTIPIMAYHFNRISLVSFIANPFILFAQPAVMTLGGAAVFVSLFLFPLGQLIAWFAEPFAAYTIRVVELFDGLARSSLLFVEVKLWHLILGYALLFGVTFGWDEIKKRIQALSGSLRAVALTAALTFLFACAIMAWRASAATGDGLLRITFLEAGSADAILIQTPEGRNLLINGGESASKLSDELGRRLPYFSRKLDWLVVASTREEQLAALPRLTERIPPENVLWSGNAQASYSAQALDKYFAAQGIPVSKAETGQRLELGDQAFIEVKAVGPRGSALLVEYKNFRALFPIGVSEGTLEALEFGNAIDKVDVLLLADSGYAPSNPPDLIENLRPQLTILSVSAGDPNGLPSQEVLDSLDGYALLRTDRSGWIQVVTDGISMRVETQRGQ
ncbi:MAG: ComEC/Rec2 family competence protein [Chloroflexi bacterium]|nr:ComEC/Rec2 family competence protein [Chloroflexota bacterium]